jgi:putative membrane protein
VQRLFGVVSIVVQTGSGTEPEATLSVLPLSALQEMREHVFAGRSVRAVDDPIQTVEAAAPGPADRLLLHLAPAELMLAGLIENRGMTLILGAIGFLSQIDSAREWLGRTLYTWLPGIVPREMPSTSITARGISEILVVTIAIIVALLLFVRVMSALWALARLYDFKLTRRDEDLRAEYGLFTHVTATIPIRRIQTISVHETLVQRWLGRAAVRVTTAGGGIGQSGSKEREWVAPIVKRERLAGLLEELYPGLVLDSLDWRRAHPGAAARMARRSILLSSPVALASAYVIGWWAIAVGLVLVVSAVVRARFRVKHLGWSLAPGGVVFRAGGLHRTTTAAPFARVQSVEFAESPFDRRTGMAAVTVDTAGTAAGELGMSYLPRGNAVELRDLVAAQSSSTAFTW